MCCVFFGVFFNFISSKIRLYLYCVSDSSMNILSVSFFSFLLLLNIVCLVLDLTNGTMMLCFPSFGSPNVASADVCFTDFLI